MLYAAQNCIHIRLKAAKIAEANRSFWFAVISIALTVIENTIGKVFPAIKAFTKVLTFVLGVVDLVFSLVADATSENAFDEMNEKAQGIRKGSYYKVLLQQMILVIEFISRKLTSGSLTLGCNFLEKMFHFINWWWRELAQKYGRQFHTESFTPDSFYT